MERREKLPGPPGGAGTSPQAYCCPTPFKCTDQYPRFTHAPLASPDLSGFTLQQTPISSIPRGRKTSITGDPTHPSPSPLTSAPPKPLGGALHSNPNMSHSTLDISNLLFEGTENGGVFGPFRAGTTKPDPSPATTPHFLLRAQEVLSA